MSNNKITTTEKEVVAYHEYLTYLKEHNNIDELGDVINKLGWSQQEFFDCLLNYINKNITKPLYAIAFDEIIETILSNNDKNIYMSLRRQGITPDLLHINLSNYLTIFRPDIKYTNKYLNKIREILRTYTDYLKAIAERNRIVQEHTAFTTNHIKDFLNSPYSIERFFLPRRISSTEFIRKYASPLQKYNPELYNKLQETIVTKNEIKNATIQNDVLLILKLIKELGNDFNSIDLFKNTMFSPKELKKAADEFLNKDDLKLFRSKINYYGTSAFMTTIIGEVRVKSFIETRFSITIDKELIETTKEEREMVIKDLKEFCIPISSETIIDDYKRLRKSKTLIKA